MVEEAAKREQSSSSAVTFLVLFLYIRRLYFFCIEAFTTICSVYGCLSLYPVFCWFVFGFLCFSVVSYVFLLRFLPLFAVLSFAGACFSCFCHIKQVRDGMHRFWCFFDPPRYCRPLLLLVASLASASVASLTE